MSDFTPQQFRMARAALNLSVEDFGAFCGVSHWTVSRIEKSDDLPELRPSTKARILNALRGAGIRFYAGRVETAVFMKNPEADTTSGESLALSKNVETTS